MSGSNDIILRAPPGGAAENINLFLPTPPLPDEQVSLTVNDVSGTDTTIKLFAPGVGDGVPTHRVGTLVGLRAETFWGNAVWGQRATTSQGVLTPGVEYTFVQDDFIDTNGVLLTAHFITYSTYGFWAAGFTGSGGNEPTIQTNRARGAGTGLDDWTGWASYVSTNDDKPEYLEAVFFRWATTTGVSAGQLSEAIIIRGDGYQDGYYFGWCEADDTWYLQNCVLGVFTTLGSSTTNQFTGTSQSRTLRITTTGGLGSNPVVVSCSVNGTTIITVNDSSADRRDKANGVNVGVFFRFSGSVDIESIYGAEQLLVLQGLTATASTVALPGLPVVKQLTGFQLDAHLNRLYPPSADQPLTGLTVTGNTGKMIRWLGIDTFTGSNNTLLGAHSADTGQSWTKENSSGTVGDPWIQSNRLQSQNGEYNSLWYLGTDQPINQVVQAVFRYSAASNGENYMSPHEGIGARIQVGSGANCDGYFFGYSAYFGSRWILWKRVAGVDQEIAQSGDVFFYSAGESHTIKMEVWGGDDVQLVCYLDGVVVIDYVDAAGSPPIGVGTMGVWLGQWDGSASGYNREWTIDTFWMGDAGDGNVGRLTGQAATLVEGALVGTGSGSGAGANLVGIVLTLSQGAMTAYNYPIGELTGNAATGSIGSLHLVTNVGVYDPNAINPIAPKLTATDHTYSGGGWYRPIEMIHQPYSVDGKLKGAGWEYLPTFIADGSRRGTSADQRLQSWNALATGALEEMYSDPPNIQLWPRFYAPYPPRIQNFSDYITTTFSVDPQGNVHVGAMRYLYQQQYQNTAYTFGWQWTDMGTDHYNGPELLAYVTGFYAYDPVRAAAFYNVLDPYVAPDAGSSIGALSLAVTQGVLTPVNVGDGSTSPLTGLVATSNAGRVKRDPLESGSSGYSAEVMLDATAPAQNGFAGGILRTSVGSLIPLNPSGSSYLAYRTCTAGDMAWSREYRIGPPTGEPWSNPRYPLFIPSGHPDIFFVSYYSDIKVGYSASQTYVGLAVVNIRTKVVISNVNRIADLLDGNYYVNRPKSVADVLRKSDGRCYAQFMHGRTLLNLAWRNVDVTPLPENITLQPVDIDPTRIVLVTPNVTHLVTLPVVTIKTLPPIDTAIVAGHEYPVSGPYRSWEGFETRGELGYYTMFQEQYLVDITGSTANGSGSPNAAPLNLNRMYANDITLPSSEWTSHTGTNTGYAGSSHPEGTLLPFAGLVFQGSGGGFPGVLFSSGDYHGGFPAPSDHSWELWQNFWNDQPIFFSVAAAGRVGRVGTTNTPNAQLVGLGLTATQGNFRGITAGGSVTWTPDGRKATTHQGNLAPPSVTFLLDLFNDTDDVHLNAHTSDSGGTWGGADVYRVLSNAARGLTSDTYGRMYSTSECPVRDYRVSANITTSGSGTHNGADIPEIAIGLRCQTDGSNGYFFGYHPVYQKWYIFKPNTYGENNVLYSWDQSGGSNPIEIEVNGSNPTRLTVRQGGVIMVVLDDYGHQYENPGRVEIFTTGYTAFVGSFLDINGKYYDPGAFFLDGLRAFTGSGVMTGPWPTGQVAYTQQGVLTPDSASVIVPLTGLSTGGFLPDENLVLYPVDTTPETIHLYPEHRTRQGVLLPAQAVGALTGLSITATGGLLSTTATGSFFVSLTGQRVYATPGFLALLNRELPGLRADVRRGDVGIVVSGDQTIAGMVMVVNTGTLKVYVNPSLLGQSTTTSPGTVKIEEAAPQPPQVATTGAGFLTPSVTNAVVLTGLGASATGGTLQAQTAQGSGPTGQSATGGAGTLVPVITKSLTGQGAAVASGQFVPLIVVTPTGQQAVTAEGTLQIIHNIALVGQSGTLVQGLTGQQHGCTVYPQGVAAKGEVGYVPTNMQKDEFEHDLFFTNHVDDLLLDTEETDAFVTIAQPP